MVLKEKKKIEREDKKIENRENFKREKRQKKIENLKTKGTWRIERNRKQQNNIRISQFAAEQHIIINE